MAAGRWPNVPFLAVLLTASVISTWPVLQSGDAFGLYDWDQHFFYYEAPRRTLVEFGQFPFWNPWYCGGVPAFANPQSPVLSLTFLLTLILGVPIGLKLSVTVHSFLGMVGGYAVAREHGIDRIASLLAGIVLMGSTAYTLHVAAGHTIWLATAYLPWACWAYLRGRDDLRYGVAIGVTLVAMTLHGQLYLVVYTALALAAWSILDTAVRRDARPLAAVALAGATFVALASVKLLPMSDLFATRDFQLADTSSSGLRLIQAALLRRDQSLAPAERLPGQQWEWWEYGAYVGPVTLGLALFGAVAKRPGVPVVAALALLFVWIAAGWNAGLWPVVQRLPLGAGLRVPSRLILMTVFFVGLLAAAGLSVLRERLSARGNRRLGTAIALGLVALVTGDLSAVSRTPLSEAFAVTRPSIGPPGAFEQVMGAQRYANRTPYATMYPYLRENRGVVNCFERFAVAPRATPKTLPDGRAVAAYRGEAYVAEGGEASLTRFSPNAIEVQYETARGGVLVLNQNFLPGWHADDSPAFSHRGLAATRVAPGSGRVRFWYQPPGFRAGLLVSAASVLALAVAATAWITRHHRRR